MERGSEKEGMMKKLVREREKKREWMDVTGYSSINRKRCPVMEENGKRQDVNNWPSALFDGDFGGADGRGVEGRRKSGRRAKEVAVEREEEEEEKGVKEVDGIEKGGWKRVGKQE